MKKDNKKPVPRPGFCTLAKITRVIDGDTVEVEITRKFNVRLTHDKNNKKEYFQVAEVNTPEGKQAKKYVEDLVDGQDQITLFIPSKDNIKLTDINSFDRLLGEIWIGDNRLTDILLQVGYGKMVLDN